MSKKSSPTATSDTVIISTPRMHELAKFYQEGLQLDPPQAQGDDHLGFPLQGTYFGFDKMTESTFEYPGAISLWFRVDDIEATFENGVLEIQLKKQHLKDDTKKIIIK